MISDKMDMKTSYVHLWEKDRIIPLLTQLDLAPGTQEHSQYSSVPNSSLNINYDLSKFTPSYPNTDAIKRCGTCQVEFQSRDDQVAHYSLEWHQLNLKRNLIGLSCVSQQDFDNYMKTDEDEDDSESDSEYSSYASDSADEKSAPDDDAVEIQYSKSAHLYFKNSDGQIISMFRGLLYRRKESPTNKQEILYRASKVLDKLYWVVILIGLCGDFSAAVFRGSDMIDHKTCHYYVSRRKQGKAQISYDSKNGNAKSAGADIRRENTAKYFQKVQEILTGWKSHLANCDKIFSRHPTQFNQLLYSATEPIFTKGDTRLHSIPFMTKKPSFNEVKKTHNKLSCVYILSQDDFDKETLKNVMPTKPHQHKQKKSNTEKKQIELMVQPKSKSESSSDGEIELVTCLQEITLRPEFSQPSAHSVRTEETDPSVLNKGLLITLRDILYTACATGNLDQLKAIWTFCQAKDATEAPDVLSRPLIDGILCSETDITTFTFGAFNRSYLHIAAISGKTEVVRWLLTIGFDPAVPDGKNQTPYELTCNDETKDSFRLFMSEYPEKFDYKKALIPGPLTQEDLQRRAERKKDKRRVANQKKKDRLKVKKVEEQEKKMEKAEAKRYLQLSDREKRALAADRRAKAANNNAVMLRCFQCAKDITGTVPFEYSDNKFCSSACVKEHRKTK